LPAAPAVSRLASPNVKAACPVIAPATASGDPLAKLSANQILKEAGTDAAVEPTVCASTPAMFQGARLRDPATVVMVSAKGARCEGTVTAPGGGFATLIKIGRAIWVWADPAYARFLQPYVKGQTSETVSARLGKWVLAGNLTWATEEVLSDCASVSFATNMMTPSTDPSFQNTRVAGFTMIDGQRTLGVTDPLGVVTYVTDTARPLPARLRVPSMPSVTQDYFDFGISATVSAPPASDVVDGSKYGLG
jgi:hypothetical protein